MIPLVSEAATVTGSWVIAGLSVAVIAVGSLLAGAAPVLRAWGSQRRHPETRVPCPTCHARRGRPCRPVMDAGYRWSVHNVRRP